MQDVRLSVPVADQPERAVVEHGELAELRQISLGSDLRRGRVDAQHVLVQLRHPDGSPAGDKPLRVVHGEPGPRLVGVRVDSEKRVPARRPDAPGTGCDEEDGPRQDSATTPAEVDGGLRHVLLRIDPRQALAVAARDPDRAEADGDVRHAGAEPDRGHGFGLRVDPDERLLVGVRDPDRAFANGDRGGAPADRHGRLDLAGLRVDRRDRVRLDRDGVRAAGDPEHDGGDRAREEDRSRNDGEASPARPSRADSRWLGPRRRRRRGQSRIVLEDPLLEAPQLLARLEAELLGEQGSPSPVDVERLRLAARVVEREHQLGAAPLSQRLLADERLQLG